MVVEINKWEPIKIKLDRPLVLPSFDNHIRCALCKIPLGQKGDAPAVKAFINDPVSKTSTKTLAHPKCPKIV